MNHEDVISVLKHLQSCFDREEDLPVLSPEAADIVVGFVANELAADGRSFDHSFARAIFESYPCSAAKVQLPEFMSTVPHPSSEAVARAHFLCAVGV